MEVPDSPVVKPVLRLVLVACGWLAVTLGLVGMFVPLLPTTPFLLLAVICFSRSSARFHRWLLTNRWFGAYIDNYHQGRGISMQEKVVTIAVLWATLAVTGIFVLTALWGRLILVAVAVGVTTHLVCIRTRRAEPFARGDEPRDIDSAGPGPA